MKNYDSLFCLLLFSVAVAFGQQVPEQVFPDEPIEPLPVVGPPTFDPTAPGIADPLVESVEPVSEVVPIAAPASPAPVSPVNKDLTELPPPPPPEENIEEIGVPGDTVGQIDESNGEYLIRDAAIVDLAKKDAAQMLESDPGLSDDENQKIRQRVLLRYGTVLELGDVG